MPRRNRFRKTVFENGLTLITEHHPEFLSQAIGVWVKVGTRHERKVEAGASHFLEHMLFKGTERRTALDIAREVDRVGGDFNAFTARETTCFHILSLSRDAGLAVDILADVVLNSNFDSTEFERERKVIQQEIAMVEENPEELVHDIFFELIYGRHGLGRPILGSETSIRRMRRADLLRFFRRHYRPDQIVISAAGNETHEQLKRKLKPLVHGKGRQRWPGRPDHQESRHALGFEPAPQLKQGKWWVVRPTEQVHLVWGVPGPTYSSRDRYAAYLLNTHLGGGMSSELFQEIREKNGLAYTVYASHSEFVDSGVFSIYAATNMGQVSNCLRLMEECVARVRRDFLTGPQLQMVKDNLNGSLLLSADSAESRMLSIARNEIFLLEHLTPAELCEAIEAVTPADVRRVARKYLRPDRASLLALGPRPSRSVKQKLGPKLLKR